MIDIKTTMGSVVRSGRWTVPEILPVRLLMASAELDFRDAQLGPGVTTIEVKVTMASLEILVPPHVHVDVQLVPFAGSVESHRPLALPASVAPTQIEPTVLASAYRDNFSDEDAAPSLRIIGKVRFGSLEVFTAAPNENWADVRWRAYHRHAHREGYPV